jgi:hypothetical protein
MVFLQVGTFWPKKELSGMSRSTAISSAASAGSMRRVLTA